MEGMANKEEQGQQAQVGSSDKAGAAAASSVVEKLIGETVNGSAPADVSGDGRGRERSMPAEEPEDILAFSRSVNKIDSSLE